MQANVHYFEKNAIKYFFGTNQPEIVYSGANLPLKVKFVIHLFLRFLLILTIKGNIQPYSDSELNDMQICHGGFLHQFLSDLCGNFFI